MIFKEVPEEFNPKFSVASCYIECAGKILLLHRSEIESEPGKWCLPGGKIEEKETELDAMVREIKEETGLSIPQDKLEYIEKLFIKHPNHDFEYHLFLTKLDAESQIEINEEHKNYAWVSPLEALSMDLMRDNDVHIKMFYGIDNALA